MSDFQFLTYVFVPRFISYEGVDIYTQPTVNFNFKKKIKIHWLEKTYKKIQNA